MISFLNTTLQIKCPLNIYTSIINTVTILYSYYIVVNKQLGVFTKLYVPYKSSSRPNITPYEVRVIFNCNGICEQARFKYMGHCSHLTQSDIFFRVILLVTSNGNF